MTELRHYTEIQTDLDLCARKWSTVPSGEGTTTINAMGVLEAVKLAWRRGYRWPADEVPTPATDGLKRLDADPDTDPVKLARYRVAYSSELKYEGRAVTHAKAMEAAQGRIKQEQADRHRESVEAQRQRAVEAKIRELSAQEAETSAARLRAKAEKAVAAEYRNDQPERSVSAQQPTQLQAAESR